MAADELHAEPAVIGPGDLDSAASKHFDTKTADLVAANGQELAWRQSLVAEIAVHVRRWGVARFARINDDDGAALTGELQRCCEARRGASDDSDIAVTLDEMT